MNDDTYFAIVERTKCERVESQAIRIHHHLYRIDLYLDGKFVRANDCVASLLPVVINAARNQRTIFLQEVTDHANNLTYEEIHGIFGRGFGDDNPSTDLRDLETYLLHHNPPFPCEQFDESNEYELCMITTPFGNFIVATDGDGCRAIRFERQIINHCYACTDIVDAVTTFVPNR